MGQKINRRNPRRFRAPHYVSAIQTGAALLPYFAPLFAARGRIAFAIRVRGKALRSS
jgi:hypothetical protein